MGLEQKLLDAVDEYDMLEASQRVLVAVSGGPDSMALLHALHTLTNDLQIHLAVAHLNHQLRGSAADDDEDYVRQWAQRWDLECFVEGQDIAARAAEQGISVEQAGRRARYEFFNRLAAQRGFARVALGHTATDRIETLLINLLRGTGLYGLRSIPPRRGQFIRPLITTRRDETVQYCAKHNLQPRLDSSNLSADRYLRNKVRLELLPLLESDYAAHIEMSLLRLAEAAEQEVEWTEPLVEAAYQRLAQSDNEERLCLNIDKLADMSEGLRYRVLRYALIQLRGDVADVEAGHYNALQQLICEGQTGGQVHLPVAIWARRGYNSIELSVGAAPNETPTDAIKQRHRLLIPGIVVLPRLGLSINAQLLSQRPDELGDAKGRQVTIDGGQCGAALFVRTWQPGDAMQPIGMSGHKKLQDIFVDEKVPRPQRARVPLIVTSADEIVWVVGYRLSEQFKVTDGTERFLRLTVAEEPTAAECDS